MLIGQTLAANSAANTVVYTPAFPRQGHGITSVIEAIALPNDTTLSIQPQHVNSEDAEKSEGSTGWTDLGSAIEFTSAVGSPTRDEESASAVKELVRYKVTLSTTANNIRFAQFRILNPSWQTTGAQSI